LKYVEQMTHFIPKERQICALVVENYVNLHITINSLNDGTENAVTCSWDW